MPHPLSVAFIWHQHQPDYLDPHTGAVRLPWARLHAAKDYMHMAELVAAFPKIHCTFNFVPSLLDQLDAIAGGRWQDEWANLSLKESWTADEKQFLLDNFFSIHPRLLERYPAYVKLRDSARKDAPDQYFRDLAGWFNLAWIDPGAIQRDAVLSALATKSEGFSRDDIAAIIGTHREIAARVVPFHRELAARGQIEISVSPYYHPILPLLVDQRSAREALPDIPLPGAIFSHPEDAAEQIRRAVSAYTSHFGAPPRGMWPSEGSVSDALVGLIPDNFTWLATDEGILARSHGLAIKRDGDGYVTDPRALYLPYRKGRLALIFRDEFLADQISFSYHAMPAQDAAHDFVNRLRKIRERLGDDEHAYLVPIVMDGENAWEGFENNGEDFFRALYTLLSNDPTLATVTVSEFLAANPPREEIARLAAGSWINSNFDTWIGGPAHNRAWELLEKTRDACAAARVDGDRIQQAWNELYVAEGSDWFWWYSPRNNSKQDGIFDELFRTHLRRVYEVIGAPAPEELSQAIRKSDQ
jgi:alpha-amylase/alpha-mannosidase (GH57 family)